jgi:hypothetical protein
MDRYRKPPPEVNTATTSSRQILLIADVHEAHFQIAIIWLESSSWLENSSFPSAQQQYAEKLIASAPNGRKSKLPT